MQFRAEQDFPSMHKAVNAIGQPDALGGLPVEIMVPAFCDKQGRLRIGQVWFPGTAPFLIAEAKDLALSLRSICYDDAPYDQVMSIWFVEFRFNAKRTVTYSPKSSATPSVPTGAVRRSLILGANGPTNAAWCRR